MSRALTLMRLQNAVVEMSARYGEACSKYAYAERGSAEQDHWDAVASRRIRAVRWLTVALTREAAR